MENYGHYIVHIGNTEDYVSQQIGPAYDDYTYPVTEGHLKNNHYLVQALLESPGWTKLVDGGWNGHYVVDVAPLKNYTHIERGELPQPSR